MYSFLCLWGDGSEMPYFVVHVLPWLQIRKEWHCNFSWWISVFCKSDDLFIPQLQDFSFWIRLLGLLYQALGLKSFGHVTFCLFQYISIFSKKKKKIQFLFFSPLFSLLMVVQTREFKEIKFIFSSFLFSPIPSSQTKHKKSQIFPLSPFPI